MNAASRAATAKIATGLAGAALVAALAGAVALTRGPGPQSEPIISARRVVLQDGRALAVQTREVTLAQWQACHSAGFCALDLSPPGNMDGDFPATGINHPDAMQFIDWVNSQGHAVWRLPTATEWHEIARGVLPEKPDPIFTDPSLTWASTYLTEANRTGRALRPSGAFSETATGVQDLDGNVWEWTQDCYAGSNGQGAAIDAALCPAFVMGGEHEAVMSYLIRDPAQGGCAVGAPPAHLGMRLVSDAG